MSRVDIQKLLQTVCQSKEIGNQMYNENQLWLDRVDEIYKFQDKFGVDLEQPSEDDFEEIAEACRTLNKLAKIKGENE